MQSGLPSTADPRIEILHERLKLAAELRASKLRAALLITNSEGRDQEKKVGSRSASSNDLSKIPIKGKESKAIAQATDCSADLPACEALLELCKDITPDYSLSRRENIDPAPRFSQRDLERSVQGSQIASNRYRRYIRKMRTFLNPCNRVELSQHTLSEKPIELPVSNRFLIRPF